MNIDTKTLTLKEANKLLTEKKVSATELAKSSLDAIKEQDSDIHAYLEVFDDVLEQAQAADEVIAKGEEQSLTGIPVALKDNIVQKNRLVTAGSKILEGHRARHDAAVTEKLQEAGAVFLGRTNLDEFAMGSSTENSAFGTTNNPHDTSRVPGGSSGGSAAAVAAGMALAAFGSDTGGSIRQPASFCGVVGLKPTYGSVSRHGLIAMGSSLDVIGPLTHSVEDAEYLYEIIKGVDIRDSTSREGTVPAKEKIAIGVPRHFLKEGVDEDVLENFEAALARLESSGFSIREVELSKVGHSLAAYYIIMFAEASTNLARFDGVRYGLHVEGSTVHDDYFETRGAGFGKEVRRRIMLGTYVLSAGYFDAYYNKAVAVRKLIADDFKQMFQEVDVLALPTAPTPAFKIGEKSDPLAMYLSDIFTVPANITGVPALSIPAGTVNREGSALPIGLQLMAPHFGEDRLFGVGKAFLGEV